jgi:peptide/nickel transport system permease protein
MLQFVVRRLLLLVPILLGLSILVFLWVRALPGDPASALLGERATESAVEDVREQYGLDRPIYVQYLAYMRLVVFDLNLGTSIESRRPVTEEISRRFPATVELGFAALAFAIVFGIPLGFFSAKRHGGLFDNASLVGSLLGISIPIFFLALILKWIFAVELGLFPTIGRQSVEINIDHPTNFYTVDAIIALDPVAFSDAVWHLVLPAIALGSIPLAIIARITRAAVLDVQNEDYVRTARAKGLASTIVDRRHVFRNAMLPVVTIIGLQTGLLLSGAILTETVFAIPGIGSWLAEAIEFRDYPVLQGGILFVAVVFVLVNLLVDVSYGLIDPRVRHS